LLVEATVKGGVLSYLSPTQPREEEALLTYSMESWIMFVVRSSSIWANGDDQEVGVTYNRSRPRPLITCRPSRMLRCCRHIAW